MVTTPSECKEALRDDLSRGAEASHSESDDPIAYLRGLTELIDPQRLDYILARTAR